MPIAAPRTTALDELGAQAALIDSLPTLPVVAIRLGEVLHSRRSSVGQVAEVLRSDPSLSAKLLKLVNSAYFGIPGGVTDVAQAIPFVGFNTIYQLVLSVSVLETLRTPSGGIFDPRPLWLHSLAVGSAARVIAEDLRHPDPGAMFTAGLLHDMGKIALAKLAPDRFVQATQLAAAEGLTSATAEARVGLPTHDRVGADLARRWRLPASLIAPIESHHVVHDPEARGRMTAAARTGADIVAVSNVIGRDVGTSTGHELVLADEAVALLETLGVTDAHRNSLHHRVMQQLERSRPFLSLLD